MASAAASTPPDLSKSALEETPDYTLGFVEFDDQGWLWDPEQKNAVVKRMYDLERTNGLILVVFAHGWKHNARADDANVEMFRTVLRGLQAVERAEKTNSPAATRRVAGVYVGWRGLSLKLWGLKNLTFWERKNTAHTVGHGAVTELLSELNQLCERGNDRRRSARTDGPPTRNLLVIVGHSFGGAVVYSAVAPLLVERLATAPSRTGRTRSVQNFGDLVVLVNPAFEAAQFQVLHRLAANRKYVPSEDATLAIFTSEHDRATKNAFPIGRWFSTKFQKHRDREQKRANRRAVGHFDSFITHTLVPRDAPTPRKPATPEPRAPSSKGYDASQAAQQSADHVQRLRHERRTANPSGSPAGGARTLQSTHTELRPRDRRPTFSPLFVVRVDRRIIPNHSDIETPAFLTFLREFILSFSEE